MQLWHFWINNQHDIEVNLFASAIAMLVDLILTLAIVARALKWREDKRWLPARRLVIAQLAKTYHTTFNSAFQIGVILRRPGDHYPHLHKAQLFLGYVNADFLRLRTLVDVNSVALGSEFLPDCSIFLEKIEETFRRLNFLKELYNPARQKQDLVGDSLDQVLLDIELVVGRFRKSAATAFNAALPTVPTIESAATINEEWATTARSTGRLHFDAGRYAREPEMVPLIIDFDPSCQRLTPFLN